MGEGERERERDLTCFTFYSKAPLLRSNFFVISQQLLLLFFFIAHEWPFMSLAR